tara:strand:- start:129 stop:629 length:501 start_codon:yes stop_codon:yes gene_type:complete
MLKINLKNILLNSLFVLTIFLADRITKIYILQLAELENTVDVYLTSYLNLYLIWNKGIAFGLFSFDDNIVYNFISLIIIVITIIILFMIIKTEGFKKYCLMSILGGSIGNVFDRIYFSAVPDFIDFHVNSYHWFVFNVADIFITLGVICLIYAEIFFNKRENEKFI